MDLAKGRVVECSFDWGGHRLGFYLTIVVHSGALKFTNLFQ